MTSTPYGGLVRGAFGTTRSRSRFVGSDYPMAYLQLSSRDGISIPFYGIGQTAGFDPSHPKCDEIPSPTMQYNLWGTNRSPTSPYYPNRWFRSVASSAPRDSVPAILYNLWGTNRSPTSPYHPITYRQLSSRDAIIFLPEGLLNHRSLFTASERVP